MCWNAPGGPVMRHWAGNRATLGEGRVLPAAHRSTTSNELDGSCGQRHAGVRLVHARLSSGGDARSPGMEWMRGREEYSKQHICNGIEQAREGKERRGRGSASKGTRGTDDTRVVRKRTALGTAGCSCAMVSQQYQPAHPPEGPSSAPASSAELRLRAAPKLRHGGRREAVLGKIGGRL